MSRVPMGSTTRDKSLGRPVNKRYWEHYEFTSQFEGAERIAEKWDITRDDTDAFGLRSQQLGAKAWAEDAFATQIVLVTVPVLDEEGKETGDTITVTQDGGLATPHSRASATSSPSPGRTGYTPPAPPARSATAQVPS